MAIPERLGSLKAPPVVLDGQLDLLRGGDEPDGYPPRLRVAGDIGQGFLADPVQGDLHAWREWTAAVYCPISRGDTGLRLPPVHQSLEGVGERATFEWRCPEVQHGATGLFEVGLGEREGATKRFSGPLCVRAGVEQGVGGLELEGGGGEPL